MVIPLSRRVRIQFLFSQITQFFDFLVGRLARYGVDYHLYIVRRTDGWARQKGRKKRGFSILFCYRYLELIIIVLFSRFARFGSFSPMTVRANENNNYNRRITVHETNTYCIIFQRTGSGTVRNASEQTIRYRERKYYWRPTNNYYRRYGNRWWRAPAHFRYRQGSPVLLHASTDPGV